jgi:hypothetical protein
MIAVTFPNREAEKRALSILIRRFSGHVMRSGVHVVPQEALEVLIEENIPHRVCWQMEIPVPPLVPAEQLAESLLEVADQQGAISYRPKGTAG